MPARKSPSSGLERPGVTVCARVRYGPSGSGFQFQVRSARHGLGLGSGMSVRTENRLNSRGRRFRSGASVQRRSSFWGQTQRSKGPLRQTRMRFAQGRQERRVADSPLPLPLPLPPSLPPSLPLPLFLSLSLYLSISESSSPLGVLIKRRLLELARRAG